MPTATTKKPVEKVSFYGGRVIVDKKPWGDHYRFTIDGRSGILSVTGVTKHLDKSRALLPWAVELVGLHITSTIEKSLSKMFHKEEVIMLVADAVLKPEQAKIDGGKTGDLIHDFTHAFARHTIEGTPMPEIPKMSEETEEEKAEAQKVLNGINAFLDWYNKNDVVFLEMEKFVYYNSLLAGDTKEGEDTIEFLGIIDVIARVNGKIGDWDYKTGKKVYTDQRYQVAAYHKAWNSNPDNAHMYCVESGVLNFSKETGDLNVFRISNEESAKDWKAFRGLHAVALREKELDDEYKASLKK